MNVISYLVSVVPPVIFNIWGPFNINTYGLCIVFALIVFFYCMMRDPLRVSIISKEKLQDLVVLGVLAGVFGGRLLYIFLEWDRLESFWQIFEIWQGGLSVLGALVAVLVFMFFYLYYEKLPVVLLLDLASLYAPLLQGVARFGCFFAGCCYGMQTEMPWAVCYENPLAGAPLFQNLHPTQLYSVLSFFCIFYFLKYFRNAFDYRPGRFLLLYLFLSGSERFFIDFWRNDRVFSRMFFFSDYQLIALSIMCLSLGGIIILRFVGHRDEHGYF